MKSVVILSGGLDSTTLLYDVVANGDETYALSFNYGQRHSCELKCAVTSCQKLSVPHVIVDLGQVGKELLQGSALTSDIDVPEGSYEAESMKLTVVPNRNMIMLSLATGYAVSIKADGVFYGAHAGDHAIYPDCRKEFVKAMQKVTKLCDWHQVELFAPYLDMDKGDIVMRGVMDLGVPYEDTWTCYKGLTRACGKCGSCTERLEAFEKAGIKDPIAYDQ